MTISTYALLQTAVADWLERDGDAALTAKLPTFVSLVEARLNRTLPARYTEAVLNGAVASRTIALPADYAAPQRLELTTFGGYAKLKAETLLSLQKSLTSGTPCAWAVDGASIKLDCPCDRAHTFAFTYRQRLALSDSVTTNWLLSSHPDVYLWGTLAEASVYFEHERALEWNARFTAALDEAGLLESQANSMATASVDAALLGSGAFNINTG